jgi:putative ABC transport system permease protein
MSGIALILGVLMAVVILPLFNQLTLQNLDISFLGNGASLLALLGLLLFVGLIEGSYPAVVLSRFQPVAVLKDL